MFYDAICVPLLLGHGHRKSGAFGEFCVLTLLLTARVPKDIGCDTFQVTNRKLHVVAYTCHPSTHQTREEPADCEFKASLGCIMSPCLTTKQRQIKTNYSRQHANCRQLFHKAASCGTLVSLCHIFFDRRMSLELALKLELRAT